MRIARNSLSGWTGVLRILIVICLSFFAAASLMGQTAGTGGLTGTVIDPSNAAVPNATVTITNLETNQMRTTMTGQDGVYKFTLLAPGTYRVKFEAPGFQSLEIPSATVNVTETETLDGA